MENSSLQRIKALFSELEELAPDTALDLGTLQELRRSADTLAHFTAARRKTLLKEYKDRVPFFKTLLLPRTLERLEKGIVCGDGCNVDTLTVSASIQNFSPYSLFNRNADVAKTVVLTDELPEDLSALAESRLFLNTEECKICYPAHWDGEISLFQRLANCFPDPENMDLPKLKAALIPQSI